MNETGVQKMILVDFLKTYRGAVAYKQSHRFFAGVPDLRLASQKTYEWNIEVKYEDRWPLRSREIKLDLTTLQRVWGKHAINAGMNWGWCLVIRDGMKGYWLKAGRNYSRQTVEADVAGFEYRARGGGWQDYDLIQQSLLDLTVGLDGHPKLGS